MDSGKPQLYVFLTILSLRVVSACLDGKFHFLKSFGSCLVFVSASAFSSEKFGTNWVIERRKLRYSRAFMVNKKLRFKIHSFFFLCKVKSREIIQFKSSRNILDFYKKFCSNQHGSKTEFVIIQTCIASFYVIISNLS